MKKLLPLFLVLIITSCSKEISDDELVTRNDITYIKFTENAYTGKLRTYYDNGQLSEFGYYKKGKLHGLYQSYYPDGGIAWDSHYKNGELHGYNIAYERNKKIITKNCYIWDRTFKNSGSISYCKRMKKIKINTYIGSLMFDLRMYLSDLRHTIFD